jgi:hypothetical protein
MGEVAFACSTALSNISGVTGGSAQRRDVQLRAKPVSCNGKLGAPPSPMAQPASSLRASGPDARARHGRATKPRSGPRRTTRSVADCSARPGRGAKRRKTGRAGQCFEREALPTAARGQAEERSDESLVTRSSVSREVRNLCGNAVLAAPPPVPGPRQPTRDALAQPPAVL